MSGSRSFAFAAADEKEQRALGALEEMLQDKGLAEQMEPGMAALGAKFGSRDRLMLAYLRAGDVKYDPSRAIARLQSTLEFRVEHGLDEPSCDVPRLLVDSPLEPVWPFSLPFVAPDGCVVQYARVGAVKPWQIVKAEGGEPALRRYLVHWLARALELQAEVEATRHCHGTYDVYDCTGSSWDQVDVSSLRVLSRCISLGTTHFPENLHRCFVINAPKWASFVWNAIKPVLNERTREKITISSGIPDALRDALGGDEALHTMLRSVPTTLPVQGARPPFTPSHGPPPAAPAAAAEAAATDTSAAATKPDAPAAIPVS